MHVSADENLHALIEALSLNIWRHRKHDRFVSSIVLPNRLTNTTYLHSLKYRPDFWTALFRPKGSQHASSMMLPLLVIRFPLKSI